MQSLKLDYILHTWYFMYQMLMTLLRKIKTTLRQVLTSEVTSRYLQSNDYYAQ